MELTIENAVRVCLRQNPGLCSIKQRIYAQRERLLATSADKWAKLETGYRYTWLEQSPYMKFRDFPMFHALPFGKDRDISWYVQFVQPVFTGFALSTREVMEKLGVDLKKVEYELGTIELRYQVKTAYLMALTARGEMEVAKKKVKALKSHLKDARAMFKQGLIAKNDLLRSEVAFKEALQHLQKAMGGFSTRKTYLKMLLNLKIDTVIILKDVSGPDVTFDKPFSELVTIAMENRPEIRALNLSMKLALLHERLAKSNYLPTINLLGRYEQNGDDLLANRNDFRNSHNAILAIEARWKFFEWGKTGHEVMEATFKVKELEKQLEDLKNNISFQIKEALYSMDVARKNIATALTALKQAQEDFRLTKLQYKELLASTTDVLDSEQYLTQARHNLINARYGYLLAMSKLERAMGRDLYEY